MRSIRVKVTGNPPPHRVPIDTRYGGPTAPLRLQYNTYEFGDEDIHIRSLRDTQQYRDPDGVAHALGISAANWALFGIVWDSSQILARLMLDFEITGKRILELGCGMALSSHLLNRRGGDITATDYHPEVEAFLRANVLLNEDNRIPYFRADWQGDESGHGRFNLIIGSDVLYEQERLSPLARFIENHASVKCEVVVVDPGRKQQGRFTRCMAEYGFDCTQEKPVDGAGLAAPFTGTILRYRRG